MKRPALTSSAHPLAWLLLASLVLAFSSSGCTEDFDPVSLVNKPRILAIASDNPRLDTNEFATLSALVVGEDPDKQFEFFWEICPFTRGDEEGYECDYSGIPPEFRPLLQGEGPEFTFLYPPELQPLINEICDLDPAVLDDLPEGLPIPNCDQGFPARARLSITDPETGDTVAAVKTIYLFPSEEIADPQDNGNPNIASLEKVGMEPPVVDEVFEVRCTVDETSLEDFLRIGEDEVRREEVLLSWYVRNGSIDKAKTFFCQDDCDNEDAQLNEVTPEESGNTTVWCVIRDGRGGIAWRQLDVEVP